MLRSLLIPALAAALLGASPAHTAHTANAAPADADSFLTYHRAPIEPSRQWILRIQMGRGFVPADAGVAGAVLGGSNMVMAASFLRAMSGIGAAGIQARLETNSCAILGQRFDIGSWDFQLQYELGRSAVAREAGAFTPYAQLGAGWSFHTAASSSFWPFVPGGAPAGTPSAMQVGSSPVLEAALGLDVQANRSLALNLQGGYRVDEPRYRMAISGAPDWTGGMHLSEWSIRGGVKLMVGRTGARPW